MSDSNEWLGVINNKLWRLRQLDPTNKVQFHFDYSKSGSHDFVQVGLAKVPSDIVDYFRLSVDLSKLIYGWSNRDPWFAKYVWEQNLKLDKLDWKGDARGIRLLRQDPVEVLFAFITSANNNVPRITKLLMKLSQLYGKRLCYDSLDSDQSNLVHWIFPSVYTLSRKPMLSKLATLGFGYRSKYIV